MALVGGAGSTLSEEALQRALQPLLLPERKWARARSRRDVGNYEGY